MSDQGKAVEKKYNINTKNVESRLKRKKLVEDIQKRELERIKQKRTQNAIPVKPSPVHQPKRTK